MAERETNLKYINAQLLKAQNLPIAGDSIRVKLHGNAGQTNWLIVDTIAARAIEDALIALAVRRDEAEG